MSDRRVAVVTGGARRLGRRLCLELAARGHDVVLIYRSSKVEADDVVTAITASGQRARALAVDVGVAARVEEAFADIARVEGRVDVLVNNVGNFDPRPVAQLDAATWDATLAANLSGAFYCCRCAIELMKGAGNIINLGAAGLDALTARPIAVDYHVAKTGLLALTRSLALAYGPAGIRVNMVSPGQLENSIDLPDAETLRRQVPLGRAGTLDEIAHAVRYLLEATYVTGLNLEVGGGFRV